MRIPRCHLPVAFLTLIVACSAVDGPAPAVAPVNVCPEYACSAYRPYTPGLAAAQCNSGACVVSAHIDYLLVVSLPETSFYAPNQSFVLASGTLFDRPTASCPTRTCARLPEVGVVVGNYVIAPRVSEEQVHYYLGNGLGQPAALPIDVVYRPLWNLAATSVPVARVGLPLLSVHAWPITVLAGTPGPARGPSPGYRTQIAAGLYERTIMPTAPFDTSFPPNVEVVTVSSGAAAFDQDVLETLDTTPDGKGARRFPTFTLTRADGGSMDGWVTYLRDQATGRRVSSLSPLDPSKRLAPPGLSYQVQLNTNRHPASPGPGFPPDALYGTDLVVIPLSPDRPTFFVPYLGGEIPADQVVPAVLEAARVSGTVTSKDAANPLAADLVFTATKLLTSAGVVSANLEHTVRTSTDPQGQFEVRLARGEYAVVVSPRVAGFGKVSLESFKVDSVNDVQAGKTLQVEPQRWVRGMCRVSDGRPLAGATVDFAPSVSLVTATLPGSRDSWPRALQVKTDRTGAFVAQVDAGVYDVKVRPAEGSRLPWLVTSGRSVGTSDSVFEVLELEVPAPIASGLTLVDPQNNALVRAVVRVFAPAAGGYVEIGRALTDTQGRYELYLAGPPR